MLFGIVSNLWNCLGNWEMRRLLRQIRRELKTAKHCAVLRGRTQLHLARRKSAKTKRRAVCGGQWLSPSLLSGRLMRHSIRSLTSATKSTLSVRVHRRRQKKMGRAGSPLPAAARMHCLRPALRSGTSCKQCTLITLRNL